jgi:hypothetical protein
MKFSEFARRADRVVIFYDENEALMTHWNVLMSVLNRVGSGGAASVKFKDHSGVVDYFCYVGHKEGQAVTLL